MRLMFLSLFFGTSIQFVTLGTSESLTLSSGVNWASVVCVDCDLVMGTDTINLVNQGFTFEDFIGKQYNEIKVISNASGTKIAYKYENY